MIDQLLLEQALNHSPIAPSPDEDVSDRIREIASQYPDVRTFRSELARYQLSERSLANRLRREKQLMEFVEFTLRPDVRVPPDQIEGYYETVLLPQLERDSGGADSSVDPPPLDDVREQIQEILTQQEIDRRLELWLQQMRRTASIGLRLE